MAKKYFTDESLQTFVDETKAYTDNAVSDKADADHKHAISDVTDLQTALDNKAVNDHKHSGGDITSGTVSADRLPKASSSAAGIVTADAQTFAGQKTFSNKIIANEGLQTSGNISSNSAATNDIGSPVKPFKDIYAKNVELYGNSNINSAGSLKIEEDGTTTVEGRTILTVGNGLAEGSEGNSTGFIDVYNNNEGYIRLKTTHSNDSFYHVGLPSKAGTLLTNKDIIPVENGGTGAATAAGALTNLGVTATAAELNYVDGVTSNIQTQLNGKSASDHTHNALKINIQGDAAVSGVYNGSEEIELDVCSPYHSHSMSDITGTLPLSQGGTNATTALDAANSLQVASLNQGTAIANGADLNTITTVGNYRCTASADSESLLNCPCTGWLFTMKVGHLPNNPTYLYQEITKFANDKRYYRRKNGASAEWSEWVISLNDTDVIPLSKGGTGATTAAEALSAIGAAASSHSHSNLKNSSYTITMSSAGSLYPNTDNAQYLGAGSYRWKQLYATTTTINTSDRNQKRDINDIDDRYIELFDLITPVTYYLVTGDRVHTGFVAQDVEEAMKQVGLTAEELGFFCKDIKVEIIYDENGNYIGEKEILDENGNPIYIYGLRYEEYIAIAVEKLKRLETKYNTKLKELDTRLAELEAK